MDLQVCYCVQWPTNNYMKKDRKTNKNGVNRQEALKKNTPSRKMAAHLKFSKEQISQGYWNKHCILT